MCTNKPITLLLVLSKHEKLFYRHNALKSKASIPLKIKNRKNHATFILYKNYSSNEYHTYVSKHRKKPLPILQQIESNIIPLLGDKELSKLQAVDISRALDVIVKRGAPILANRILSSLKQAFNFAVSRGNIHQNPAISIRSRDIGGLEKPRERVLAPDEIRKVWRFLDSEQSKMSISTKSAIKIIILTGVRTAEIRLATWNGFDFINDLWTIPPENIKGGITVKIHLEEQILTLIQQGEGISLELKTCRDQLNRDIFETVCSFLNRHGGTILFGVQDSGEIKGVNPNAVEKIKKDFINIINNPQKIHPPTYLSIQEIAIQNKIILRIYVPESSQVHRCIGRIYDRNGDGDYDITDHTIQVAHLYARKQATYSENKVYPHMILPRKIGHLAKRPF